MYYLNPFEAVFWDSIKNGKLFTMWIDSVMDETWQDGMEIHKTDEVGYNVFIYILAVPYLWIT